MALGLARGERDERTDDETAERGDREHRPPRKRARERERILGIREPVPVQEIAQAVRIPEEDAREETDQDAERDRGEGAADTGRTS